MQSSSKLRVFSLALLLGAASIATPINSLAQTAAPSAPDAAPSAATSWTTEQLLTSTVHDAWILSGKDETKFFEMVKTLAELSSEKRGITLPDSKEAGMRMGANIKRLAKADTDQLLYAVVDKAVMLAAHSKPTPVGSRGTTQPAAQQ